MSARCRVQQATCGHRDRKGEPLYAARRTLHTGCVRNGDTRRFRTAGRLCYGSDWYSRQRDDHNVVMDPIDPDLALAFTSAAAVGSSMIRAFRIDDAKACTRLCRRILLFAAAPPPSDLAGILRALSGLDNVLAALGLLTRRLAPLGTADAIHLRNAEAALTSLRDVLGPRSAADFHPACTPAGSRRQLTGTRPSAAPARPGRPGTGRTVRPS